MIPPSVAPRISELLNTADEVEVDARNSGEARATDDTDKLSLASNGRLRVLDAWCNYSAVFGWAHYAIALVEDFDHKFEVASWRLCSQ